MRTWLQICSKTSHGLAVSIRSKSSSSKLNRTNPSTTTCSSVSILSRHHLIFFDFRSSSTTFIPPFTNENCQFQFEFNSRFEIDHSPNRTTQRECSYDSFFTRSWNSEISTSTSSCTSSTRSRSSPFCRSTTTTNFDSQTSYDISPVSNTLRSDLSTIRIVPRGKLSRRTPSIERSRDGTTESLHHELGRLHSQVRDGL